MRMNTSRERASARMAAARALVRLGIDARFPIDIFKVIQDEGIWLMFQPLRNLYGAYLPQEDVRGIIIHSKHPLSTQRFTAAHEFGHYVLQHPLSMDDEGLIERAQNSSDSREIAADTFAAFFLMPLELVNSTLRHRGLPLVPGSLTAVEVYQFSLDLGVSYSAAVNHLSTLGKITRDTANALRRWRPKDIKAQIGGSPLENSWADIFVLDQSHVGKRLRMRVYDELRISLPESPTTGYVWTLAGQLVEDATRNLPNTFPGTSTPQGTLYGEHMRVEDPSSNPPILTLIRNEFEAKHASGEQARFGGAGDRYLTFRAMRPGEYTLRLSKRRPWQMAAPPTEEFDAYLDIAPKPTGDSDQGLSFEQQPLLGGV